MAKAVAGTVMIDLESLDHLLAALADDGYELVAPTVADGAIIYDRIGSQQDLPIGWTDEQEGGYYRLKSRDDQARFGYVVGPQSWKQYLFPPEERLWRARKSCKGSLDFQADTEDFPRRALIGVRACELHAMAIQDKVFLGGSYADELYRARRERIFVVAVNCTTSAPTCFCASMNTGPRVEPGPCSDFDLALTEVAGRERHYFLLETGSERGQGLLERLVDDHLASEAQPPRLPALKQRISSAACPPPMCRGC